MASLFSASFQNFFAIFAALSLAVTMLILAFAVTRLIGTFHKLSLFCDVKILFRAAT
jgi:uncharacterized membrane protein